jgi:hypothetical protein
VSEPLELKFPPKSILDSAARIQYKEIDMKKITIMAVVTVLFAGLLFMGCIENAEGNNDNNNDVTVNAQGKLLILQAYGNAGGNSPAGVSHSFVELYNISNKAINLSGISLYYAEGVRGEDVTEDEPWQRINLTGSIPAKGSFLILGKKHDDLSGTRYTITDGYGDINNNNLALSRRGFKTVLINGSASLTAQNPFTAGSNGKPISGYIDMVGALNNPVASPPDHIFGYETAPARNSASAAIRRADLLDTDDNSADFEEINYSFSGITNEELEVRKPRNSSAGSWDPFAEPGEPTPPPLPTGNKLLIFQAYGGDNANGVSHHFVELYNNGGTAVNLSGYSLQYAAASDGDTPESDWTVIPLTGSIPAKTSYLILGQKNSVQTQRIQIADNSGDVNKSDFVLSNRGFKAALINSTAKLTVANPYNTDGNWKKAAGYIDMVGCSNTFGTNIITGYEGHLPITDLPRNSAQEGIRRKNLTDTDNNVNDFVSVRYTTSRTAQYPHGVDSYEIPFYTPKNAAAGAWDPMDPPPEPDPPVGSAMLMILQVYGAGFGVELGSNDNTNTGSISHNFIELYNNTNAPIDLSAYSVQWANGKANGGGTVIAADEDWNVIPLTGTIPAYGSYLIRGRKMNDQNGDVGRLQVSQGDIDDNNFYMSNRSFKVALVSNQTKISLSQPWNNLTNVPLISGLLDLVGARNGNNDSVEGYKGAMFDTYSKQQSIRRGSLADTDNNRNDFVGLDYRNWSAGNAARLTDEQVDKFRPRTAAETASGYTPQF